MYDQPQSMLFSELRNAIYEFLFSPSKLDEIDLLQRRLLRYS